MSKRAKRSKRPKSRAGSHPSKPAPSPAPCRRDRLPSARDARMRAGMAALLTHGSERKAAEACGIPRITLKRWANSPEGRALLDELQASPGTTDRVGRIWSIFDEGLGRLEKKLRTDDIRAKDLAIALGILADKAKALAPKGEDPGGTWKVTVNVGGNRVEQDEGEDEEAAPRAQITVEGRAVPSDG